MESPMNNTEQLPLAGQAQTEFCRLMVMFPVRDDETAMNLKKEVSRLIADIPGVQMTFTMANVRTPLPGA